jgi:hypothetical protein
LKTVASPLQVLNRQEETIERAEYKEATGSIRLIRKAGTERVRPKGYSIGDWIFVKGEGFYQKEVSGLLSLDEIPPHQIPHALTTVGSFLRKWLNIDPTPHAARYALQINSEGVLFVDLYLFEPQDLKNHASRLFGSWVYQASHGFYLLEDLQFSDKETIVPPSLVSDFVNRHRVWLKRGKSDPF